MKNYKDGWHIIAGYEVYVENNMVIRPYGYGSLYYWSVRLRCYINLLPCTPARLRYYEMKGKVLAK